MIPAPKHIALIMDGNGRWAEARNKNRFWGHIKGSEVAQTIVEHCSQNTEIECLTLYAFSTENWSRPFEEVKFLFKLLERHLKKKSDYLIENNVCLRVIGRLEQLPVDLQSSISRLVEKTKNNNGLNLTLALNYGGKQELVDKINHHFSITSMPIDEQRIDQLLAEGGNTNPDLIIRTSGEQRLSNFMLWQSAYSELYFTKTLWPDFAPADLDEAIAAFQGRERRFGSAPLTKTLVSKQENRI
jgi:undecaprenyl diphosphate synthase